MVIVNHGKISIIIVIMVFTQYAVPIAIINHNQLITTYWLLKDNDILN